MLTLLSILTSSHHECAANILKLPDKKKSLGSPLFYKEGERVPIDIFIDYEGIDKKDQHACYEGESGDSSFGEFKTQCEEKYILTEKKKKAYKGTLENVRAYLYDLIKINSQNDTFEMENCTQYGVYTSIVEQKTDLFISAYARPLCVNDKPPKEYHFAAQSFKFNLFDYRPEQAFIIVSPVAIPDEAQNIDSPDNLFFMEILHQFIHILGMDSKIFKNWNERIKMARYNPTPEVNFTINETDYSNRNFRVIQTKVAINYTKRHFGRADLADGVDYGFELESHIKDHLDSHLSPRLYFGEVSAPVVLPGSVVSDATLGLLEDMGWYTCNYSKATPLTFLRGGIDDEEPQKSYAIYPPESNRSEGGFPERYFCPPERAGKKYCSIDFRSIADCPSLISPPNCDKSKSGEDYVYCNAPLFYNPNNKTVIPNTGIAFEWQNFPIPSTICTNSLITKDYETYGPSSKCFEFSNTNEAEEESTPGCFPAVCAENNTINITIRIAKGQTEDVVCNASSVSVKASNGIQINCPDPKIFCRTQKALSASVEGFELDPLPGDTGYYNKWIIIVVVVVVVIVVAVIALISYFCCCRKKKSDSDDGKKKKKKKGGKKKKKAKKAKKESDSGSDSSVTV